MTRPTLAGGMRPLHPGEILREDYLRPLGLSVQALAQIIDVPIPLIEDIVQERRAMSAEVATRLVRHFGGDVGGWQAMQAAYDRQAAELAAPGEATDGGRAPRPSQAYTGANAWSGSAAGPSSPQ